MELFGWTDAHEAAYTGDVGDGSAVGRAQPTTRDNFTPLHVAAVAGQAEVVAALLSAGVDATQAVDKYRGGALELALLRRHWAIAAQLLDRGLTVDAGKATLARRVAAMGAGARCKEVDGRWVIDKAVELGDGASVLARLPGPPIAVEAGAFDGSEPTRDGAQTPPLCIVLRDIAAGQRDPGEEVGSSGDPLHQCLLFGHLDVARALVQAGAPVDRVYDGETALVQAVKAQDEPLVDAILAAGATVDVPGRFQRTPLMIAAEKKHEGLVRCLLAAGADLAHTDQFGKTAWDLAKGQPWAEELLRGDAGPGDPTENLLDAAQAGQLGAATQALAAGADPSAQRDGRTALHWAVLRRHTDLVGPLLEGGVPIDAVTSGGHTALLLACEYAHAVVPTLLAAGARVDLAAPQGTTALLHACRHGSAEVVTALLDAGADPEGADAQGWRAVHRAVYYVKRDIVGVLLAAGVSLTATTNGGWTPLMFAAKSGAHDLVTSVRAAAPDVLDDTNDLGETAAFLAAEDGHSGALAALEGADLERADTSGKTPLLVACAKGHAPAVRELLRQGASPDVRDNDGAGPEKLGTAHRYVLRALGQSTPPAQPPVPQPAKSPPPPPPSTPADVPMPKNVYAAAKAGPAGLKKYLDAHPDDAGSALQDVTQRRPADEALLDLVLGYQPAPNHVGYCIGYAAKLGRLAFLDKLLAVPWKLRRKKASEPVYAAVFHGHPDAVRKLLAAGLDGDTLRPGHEMNFSYADPPEDGAHPLLLAIAKNDVALVTALVEGGVQVNFCSHTQRSPLDMARALEADAALIEVLLAHGATPIHDDLLDLNGAAIQGRAARVATLAPDAEPSQRDNAVRLACDHGHRDVLEALFAVDDGLRPHALGCAAGAGQLGLVQWLVDELGTGVHHHTTYADKTPLHFAAYGGRTEVAAWLLAKGADVLAKDKDDAHPLHDAARGKHPAVVELLLAHGADAKARCDEGKNALAWSKMYGGREDDQKAVARLLKGAGAKTYTPAHWKRSLRKKLKPYARDSFKPRTRSGAGEPRGSRFGGDPWLAQGESWPMHGEVPAQFLFQIDLEQLPTDVGRGLLRVFLRPEGGFRPDDTTCLHTTADEGAVVAGSEPLPARRITGFNKPKSDLPGEEARGLVTLDPAEVEHLRSMAAAGDKVGGWPHWIQDEEYPKGFGRFVLQVDTGGALAFSYADSGIGVLLQHDDDPTRFRMVWQTL